MLEFRALNGALQILYDNRLIFKVSEQDALLEVGSGSNDYVMKRGSFRITETFARRKTLAVVGVEAFEASAKITLTEGSVLLTAQTPQCLRVDFEGLSEYNRLWMTVPAEASEHVYGAGENFTAFDLRGEKVNVWVAEHNNALQVGKKLVKQLVGIRNSQKKQKLTDYETYYAQPTYLSSRRYFFHSASTARNEFDFTAADRFVIKTDTVAPCWFGFGKTFEDVLQTLSDLLGRQPPLPDWVYDGEILGIQGGTQIMMDKVENVLAHGADVCGVWIQDWEGRRVTAAGKQLVWNWEWDAELYPELPDKIKALADKGVRVLGYCNPFLAVEKALYTEASALGYCVKNEAGEDYYVTITTFPAAMIDLTNPDAVRWLKDKIKTTMIDFGLSGWMADFGEYLPTDCVLFSKENPELVHNTWPARWARLNRELLEETGKLGEIMFFTRAGYSETPRYSTMMWNGDNHVDFSMDFGLPSVIPATLNLTVCGFGLSHSDIGGYTSFFNLKRSEETYMRWCEMNAFSPLMRSHEGLNPDLNAQFDASEQVLCHGAVMSRMHKALKPYLKDAVAYNAEKGVGVVRPLFFYYPEEAAFNESYEYLLGRDILVAPVLRPDAKIRRVFLPNDMWVHAFTGREYGGGVYDVPAPLGCPPVFVRKNGGEELLDLQKTLQKIYQGKDI